VSDLSAIVHLREGVDPAQGGGQTDAVDWPNALKKYRAFPTCEDIMHKHQRSHAAAVHAAFFVLSEER
jgi:hypothetical protein